MPRPPTTPPPQQIAKQDILDYGGLSTNVSAEDMEPGKARWQVNVSAEQKGMLRPRRGYLRIVFVNPLP